MGTNRPWNWGLAVLKTIKMMQDIPLMTNFKMTVRADCVISAYNPLPLSIKALAPWLSWGWGGGVRLWAGVPGIQNKANFPFHQTHIFITVWSVSRETPLLVTNWHHPLLWGLEKNQKGREATLVSKLGQPVFPVLRLLDSNWIIPPAFPVPCWLWFSGESESYTSNRERGAPVHGIKAVPFSRCGLLDRTEAPNLLWEMEITSGSQDLMNYSGECILKCLASSLVLLAITVLWLN